MGKFRIFKDQQTNQELNIGWVLMCPEPCSELIGGNMFNFESFELAVFWMRIFSRTSADPRA